MDTTTIIECNVDMTSDATRNCRVHVGNLSPGFKPDAIKILFNKCGNIVGISPKTNYMFIQFATEDGAKNAIKLSKKYHIWIKD